MVVSGFCNLMHCRRRCSQGERGITWSKCTRTRRCQSLRKSATMSETAPLLQYPICCFLTVVRDHLVVLDGHFCGVGSNDRGCRGSLVSVVGIVVVANRKGQIQFCQKASLDISLLCGPSKSWREMLGFSSDEGKVVEARRGLAQKRANATLRAAYFVELFPSETRASIIDLIVTSPTTNYTTLPLEHCETFGSAI